VVRIFNEKEVDELVFLDISVTRNKREIDYELIKDMTSEGFIPIAYGGGVCSIRQVEHLFRSDVEKVVINSHFSTDPGFISECNITVGSQRIVVSIGVKKLLLGRYEVYTHNGKKMG